MTRTAAMMLALAVAQPALAQTAPPPAPTPSFAKPSPAKPAAKKPAPPKPDAGAPAVAPPPPSAVPAGEEAFEPGRARAAFRRRWSLSGAWPHLASLDVAAIDVPHVLAVLEQKVAAHKSFPAGQFWTARSVTADRVRNRIEAVLNFASARGYRPKGPNPAA